jgi:hypothetical protein
MLSDTFLKCPCHEIFNKPLSIIMMRSIQSVSNILRVFVENGADMRLQRNAEPNGTLKKVRTCDTI